MSSPPPASARPAWDGIGRALVLAALALCAWLPAAVGGGFSFDDREVLEHNPVVQGWLPASAAFQRDYWEHRGAAGHFRPLASLSLRFDYALWGEQASGFHATNIALHALVVLAAALFAGRWFQRGERWPWIGLAVFAVHPVLADSVAWISGRSSMLSALPGLCAAWWLARSDAREPHRAIESAGVFACGLLGAGLAFLGKEDGLIWAIALPLIAARRGHRATAATAAGCLAGIALVLALRAQALGSPWISAPNAPLAGVALQDRLLVGGRAMLEALRLFAWPADYPPNYSGDPAWSVSALRAAPALGILGIVAWLAAAGLASVAFLRERTLVSATTILVLVACAPFLQVIPSGEIFAPRFLYLPLLFAIPLLQAGFDSALGRRAPIFAAIAVLALIGAIWSRGRVYSSRGAYRLAVLDQRPDDVPSWNDLGLYYEEEGEIERAREAWLHATRIDAHYSRAWSNLGRLELSEGHGERACELLERAVLENPNNAIAQLNLGSARMSLRDLAGAEASYRAAIQSAPGLARAWEGLAHALRDSGRASEAREAVARWLELEPGNARALQLEATL